jgi:hypothetical protein
VQSNLIARKLSSTYNARIADVTSLVGVSYVAPYKEMVVADIDYLSMLASAPDNSALAWTRDQYNASLRGFRRTA